MLLTTPSRSLATVFVGALRSPGGRRRLVAVELYRGGAEGTTHFVVAQVVEPGSLVEPPRARGSGNRVVLYDPGVVPADVRVYAGQVDRSDSSQFVVPFVADGKPKELHGWLTDQDAVVMSVRDRPGPPPGPATSPGS
jgi:hypothetical protein